MALDTVQNLANGFAEDLGENTSDIDTREQFARWVVGAVKKVWLEHPWSFKQTVEQLSLTLAAGAEYSLSADMTEVFEVTLDGIRPPLRFYMSVRPLLQSQVDLTQTGQPRVVYVAGKDATAGSDFKYRLGFYPAPSTSYTANVYGRVGLDDAFGDDPEADKVPLPPDFYPLIEAYVLERFYKDDTAQRDRYALEYATLRDRLIDSHRTHEATSKRFQYSDMPSSRSLGAFFVSDDLIVEP